MLTDSGYIGQPFAQAVNDMLSASVKPPILRQRRYCQILPAMHPLFFWRLVYRLRTATGAVIFPVARAVIVAQLAIVAFFMKQADEFRQAKRATLWVVSVGLLIIYAG